MPFGVTILLLCLWFRVRTNLTETRSVGKGNNVINGCEERNGETKKQLFSINNIKYCKHLALGLHNSPAGAHV